MHSKPVMHAVQLNNLKRRDFLYNTLWQNDIRRNVDK